MFKCVCCGKEVSSYSSDMCINCLNEYADFLINEYRENKEVKKMKAKIVGIAWASPVKRLPIGAVVEVLDKINDVAILVRYKGYKYIIKEASVKYIEEGLGNE